jgi:hypothetical protein
VRRHNALNVDVRPVEPEPFSDRVETFFQSSCEVKIQSAYNLSPPKLDSGAFAVFSQTVLKYLEAAKQSLTGRAGQIA